MGVIFISHSSSDNTHAIRIRDWLHDHGWGETFLDLDPKGGLAAGQRWQEALKREGERCSAVLLVISPAWVESKWCQVEALVASQLGKHIFGVIVAPAPIATLPIELSAQYQLADISNPATEREGFDRLKWGLKRAGLDPRDFAWPPPGEPGRDAYRGLRGLEEQDAGIFFGRDAAITRGLDAMRRLRDGAPERMLVVLGASGAGKSSFLKAGLLARLRRDEEHFLVLPIVRPERLAMTGPQGLLQALGTSSVPSANALATHLAALRDPVVTRLQRRAEAAGETRQSRPPTIVLPIDQAEELFAADSTESAAALDLLCSAFAADDNLVSVLTVRSDSYEKLQAERRLAEVPRLPFDLPPLTPGAFKEVIEGPGRLATPPIVVEPALTDRLLADLDQADALPLLACTLERLVADYGQDGTLELREYEVGLKGLAGAIQNAIDAAYAAAIADPALPNDRAALEPLARRALIPWLVRVETSGEEPKRRVAALHEIPDEAQPLISHFIDQRLLVSDVRRQEAVVEVAHEAVLRHWPGLPVWIDEERAALRSLESVQNAARDWRRQSSVASHQSPDARSQPTTHAAISSDSWLTHRGDRLAEAEGLLRRPDYAQLLGENGRAYLEACRVQQTRDDLQTDQRRARAIAAMARATLDRAPQRALLLAAEAMELAPHEATDAGAAIVGDVHGQPVGMIGPEIAGLQLSGDGRHVARLRDRTLTVWSLDDCGVAGEAATRAVPESGQYPRLQWAGRRLLVTTDGSGGGALIVCEMSDPQRVVEVARFPGTIIGADRQGAVAVVRSADQTTRVIAVAGAPQEIAHLPAHRSLAEVAFSPDGRRFVLQDQTCGVLYRLTNSDGTFSVRREAEVTGDLTYRFSPDGRWMLSANTSPGSGGSGAEASIWTLAETGETTLWHRFGGRNVAIAEFSPDSRWLAFVGWNDMYQDEYVRLFRLTQSFGEPHLLRQIEEINQLVYSGDSHWIVSASRHDDNAFAWDLRTLWDIEVPCAQRALSPIPLGGHGRGAEWVTFAGSDTTIVTLSRDGTLRRFELEKQTSKRGSELEIWRVAPSSPRTLRGHDGPITTWMLSADERTLVTIAASENARLWRLPARSHTLPSDLVNEARRLAGRALREDEARELALARGV